MKYLLIVFLLFSGGAFAQQINVRSGMHDDFVRIVLDVPLAATWTTKLQENGISVKVNGHTSGFNTSTIFSRIDRSIVSAVNSTDSSLDIQFSCKCAANVFPVGERMIVLDVKYESEELALDFPAAEVAFVGQARLSYNGVLGQFTGGSNLERKYSQIESKGGFSAIAEVDFFPTIPSTSIHTKSNNGNIQKLQTELSKRVGEATTRGLLKPSDVSGLTTALRPQIDVSVFDSSSDFSRVVVEKPDAISNINVTSSLDAPYFTQETNQLSTSFGTSCIDPELVAVQNWGSENGFQSELAFLRGKLFGEFDELNFETVVKLAKMYLHYGFGAEAYQVLHIEGSIAEAHPVLVSMAEVMEHGNLYHDNFFEGFSECDNAVALWVILSSSTIDPENTFDIEAALLGLNALPVHLRNFIAPELSRRLLTYGDETGAAAALRSLERTADALSPDANFAKARLELAQGGIIEAQERLSDVVSSNAEQSAEALIEFVDSHLNIDIEIDEEIATLVEAYALEMRDSPIGNDLERAHVLALGKSGQFSRAFDALYRAKKRDPNERVDALRSSVLSVLTREATDSTFLNHAFDQMLDSPETISASDRFLIAKRFVELGFYKEGEAILAVNPQHLKSSEKSLLQAEISIKLSRPGEALAHLVGETSVTAASLRAQAETDIGEFEEAHATYSNIGDNANSIHTAWLSEDWMNLIDESVPVVGPIVGVSQEPLADAVVREGMLQRSAEFVSESKLARKAIEDLLEEGWSDIFAN